MLLSKPRYSRHKPRILAVITAILMLMLCPSRKILWIFLLGLAACLGIFTTTAFASTSGDTPSNLIVNAAWLDGEKEGLSPTIRIDVTDPKTGTRSAIAVPIYDHLRDGENIEFITIQAVDPYGRQSGVIQIRNPFFNSSLPQSNTPESTVGNSTGGTGGNSEDVNGSQNNGPSGTESAIEIPGTTYNLRPLTPDGTGTVVDNVTDSDGGREFFTIFSEDGNEFFLIIDRHRNVDNVYFLNAVTEEDLMSLARRSGREITNETESSISAIPVPPQTPDADESDSDSDTAPPEPEPPIDERPTALSRIGSNLLFFVGIIVVVGGIVYYFKVVRPKKDGFSSDYGDDESDDYDYDNAADEEDDDLEDGDED